MEKADKRVKDKVRERSQVTRTLMEGLAFHLREPRAERGGKNVFFLSNLVAASTCPLSTQASTIHSFFFPFYICLCNVV